MGENLGEGQVGEKKGPSETGKEDGAAVKDGDEGGADLGGNRGGEEIGSGYILGGEQREHVHPLDERVHKSEMMMAPKFFCLTRERENS